MERTAFWSIPSNRTVADFSYTRTPDKDLVPYKVTQPVAIFEEDFSRKTNKHICQLTNKGNRNRLCNQGAHRSCCSGGRHFS